MTLQKNNKRIVIISAAAAEDLKDIWDYLAKHSENAAGKLVKEVKNKFILLRDNPLVGREQNKCLVGLPLCSILLEKLNLSANKPQ